MAKIKGPQEIPAELLDGYRASMGEITPIDGVRKRYPYRVPTMQTLIGHPSTKQKGQRTRFITAKDNFANVAFPTRQRWYAAAPEWGSFLWYYNYFIMSSLAGNANIPDGGAGMIKSLQHKTISMPSGAGEGSVAITAVDITRTVVMIHGSSYMTLSGEVDPIPVIVYPYISSVASELVKCKWSIPAGNTNTVAATISITVIEYI